MKVIDQFVHDEPTPQKMMTLERDLSILLRDVGRRIMAWVLNHLEPKTDEETPPRVQFEGHLYRR